MIAFLIKRLMHAILVMFVISVLAFAIQDNLGDPVQQMVGQSVPESEREAIRERLGLNDPFLVQYVRFAKNAVQGDFGYSYFYREPALEVIARHLPATLELVFAATLIIVLLSVPIGVYSAIKPRSPISRFFMGASIIGISIPVFLTAIVLIQIFSIGITVSLFPEGTAWGAWLNGLLSTEGNMPSFGRGYDLVHVVGHWDTNLVTWNGLQHLVLP
ncbi:MAG TPA: ABC transporter permease, partial [Halomonas sp.]|nr:ABC transporter permease [Halomonas sp.]